MGTSDGSILGATKILNNGPDANRLNVVLVAEGFKATEQMAFNTRCDEFVTALQGESWYPAVGGAINVHRINVASTDSGADDPVSCPDEPGDGTVAATYFNATFCTSGLHRCLAPSWSLVKTALNDNVPKWHVGAVLVNTAKRGGCASSGDHIFATGFGTKPGEKWEEIALHELGHAAFGLADEYPYRLGCDSGETGHDHAPGFEPSEPNVTAVKTLAALKWKTFVPPEVPIPTMQNADCTKCDDSPNVLPSDSTIGSFEGARYFHCGLYRPAYGCRMRKVTYPFCGVCVQAIADRLGTFITPTPRMEVVTGLGSLLLDFGDVTYGLTMYRYFEVRNKRVGFPGTLRVTLTAPTGQFGYAPNTDLSFTLPAPVNQPFTSRKIFVAFTAPSAGGPGFSGSLHVTTPDDPLNPMVIVDLLAHAVAPKPVDSVLVFDRSGSMSEPTGVPNKKKVDLAIEAGQLYVSLLRDEDRIGIVRFNDAANDPADILLNLEVAGEPTTGSGRVDAVNALTTANLAPSGFTSIGAGILLGSKVLDAAVASSRAVVVLTDGIQNTPPDIPVATAAVAVKTPKQRVFAVGLGLNQLEDKLAQIASVTNGVAQITGELVGYREFLLHKLYVQILTDVSDEAFVKDPLGIVPAGEKRATPIFLGEVDVAVDFIVVFRRTSIYPRQIRVWLEAPDGTIVRPGDAAVLPNVEYVEGRSHLFFRWLLPAFPDRPTAHVGRWLVWVENRAKGHTPADAEAAGSARGGPFYYSVMCKARSDLRLGGHLLQPAYTPGSPMRLVLEPTVYGQPIELDAPPEVTVLAPNNVGRTMGLVRDSDGTYRGDFTDTAAVGPYLFSTEVAATSPGGNHVTRFRQFTGIIFHPDKTGGGQTHPGGRGDCEEARVLIRKLAEIIERCCCREQHPHDGLTATSAAELLSELTRRLEAKS